MNKNTNTLGTTAPLVIAVGEEYSKKETTIVKRIEGDQVFVYNKNDESDVWGMSKDKFRSTYMYKIEPTDEEQEKQNLKDQLNVIEEMVAEISNRVKATKKEEKWLLYRHKVNKTMCMRPMYKKPTRSDHEEFMCITDELTAATICNRYNNTVTPPESFTDKISNG